MGLFGGKINKITPTHAENISDKDIAYNIMSSTDAKRNFSNEEFRGFMQLFNHYCSEKTPFPTNSERYSNRAFSIAYDFESYGFPYEYCHGSASDVYQMYTLRKPLFDDAVEQFIDHFRSLIEGIIDCNENVDEYDTMRHSAFFLSYTIKAIENYGNMQCATDYLPFYFETCQNEYLHNVISEYAHDDEGKERMTSFRQIIVDSFKKRYDEGETFEGFLYAFAKDFMTTIGAQDDEENYKLLTEEIDEWIDMAKEYQQAY